MLHHNPKSQVSILEPAHHEIVSCVTVEVHTILKFIMVVMQVSLHIQILCKRAQTVPNHKAPLMGYRAQRMHTSPDKRVGPHLRDACNQILIIV